MPPEAPPACPYDPLALAEDPDGACAGYHPYRPPKKRAGGARAGLEPTDGLPWAHALRTLGAPRFLMPSEPRAASPPGFRGQLYPPQATMLAAMLALEAHPFAALEDARLPRAWEGVLETRAGLVAERFSFGKTVLALALVCASPLPGGAPRPVPASGFLAADGGGQAAQADVDPLAGNYRPQGWSGAAEAALFSPRAGFLPTLELGGAGAPAPLRLTVVVATAAVLSQWEANVRRFTALRCAVVGDLRGLRALAAVHAQGGTAALDLLLVKAGRVAASFRAPGEPPVAGKDRPLLAALAALLGGPVARLIVDDFDTLRLTGRDALLPAQFTWLMSATLRPTRARLTLGEALERAAEEDPAARPPPGAPAMAAPSPRALARACGPGAFPLAAAALDGVLASVFCLQCAPAYVDEHLGSTAVAFRQICVRGGRAAAALHALGVADEIVELVHAEAIGPAARALGLEAQTAGELLRRVLGERLAGLLWARRTLARVGAARAALAALADGAAEGGGPPPRARPAAKKGGAADGPAAQGGPGAPLARAGPTAKEEAAALRLALQSGADAEFAAALRALTRGGAAAAAAVDALEERAQRLEALHAPPLNRMRDNIREGYCQCCKVPFGAAGPGGGGALAAAGAAFVLAGCCQLLACEPCLTRPHPQGVALLRRCPNCARDVAAAGLVRVGDEVDLGAALGGEAFGELAASPESVEVLLPAFAAGRAGPGARGGPEADAEAEEGAPPLPGEPDDNPRLAAFLQLARGEAPDCLWDRGAPPFVAGLLAGRRDAPWPEARPKKLLVYASHPSTMALLRGALGAAGVPWAALRGTRAQRDAALAEFSEGGARVLLVCTPADCAGLDLPGISHVVFYHRVTDAAVRAQVAGRGQRAGREHNLEIVALLDEGEAQRDADAAAAAQP